MFPWKEKKINPHPIPLIYLQFSYETLAAFLSDKNQVRIP